MIVGRNMINKEDLNYVGLEDTLKETLQTMYKGNDLSIPVIGQK